MNDAENTYNEITSHLSEENVSENLESKYFNVMILDDDPSITKLIEVNLRLQSERCNLENEKLLKPMRCLTFNSELDALEAIKTEHFDICIIDITLSYTLGFSVGKIIRTMSQSNIPIIYISSDTNYLRDFYKVDQRNTYFFPKPLDKNSFHDVFVNMIRVF